MSADVALADRAKMTGKGLQGVQRIVRWVASVMLKLAQYGKKLTCDRVSPLELLGFATDRLGVQPTKLCKETLSPETASVPQR